MLELLNFFEEATDSTGGAEGGGFQMPPWVLGAVLGVIIVGLILFSFLSSRRQKKRNQDMMSRLAIGSIVTTIGGIVGEVVEMDDAHIWLLTGTADSKTTMQFVRQAIHAIAPAPGSPEAEAIAQAQKDKDNEVDEIK